MAEADRGHAEHPTDESDATMVFLERLAHDLRGPLSPLQTAAYLLRRDDIGTERQHELLEIIDRQTTRLSGMVQEVSDWMRARQSRLVGHRERIGVPMLLEMACAPSGPTVKLDVAEELDEVMIDGDAQRLVQMLSTLVTFMQARGDSAAITGVRATSAEGRIRIVIETPESSAWADGEREVLFGDAQQVPFDEGLGMRLLIAQAIARAHGGEVAVGEMPTGGAWMGVQLPLAD